MAYIYWTESRFMTLETQKIKLKILRKREIDAEDRIKRGVEEGIGYACQNDLLSKFNLTAALVKASNFLRPFKDFI